MRTRIRIYKLKRSLALIVSMCLLAVLTVLIISSCQTEGDGRNAVSSGTISGYAFFVIHGTLYQEEEVFEINLTDPSGGYRVGFALQSATLHAVSFVDDIVWPCK